MMKISISELEKSMALYPDLRFGCIVDTNVLFAASYISDVHNDWAENVFKILHKFDIPTYTNLNVRAEFIDLHRRVLIPECLIDFYDELSNTLDPRIYEKLKLLKRRANEARKEARVFKLNDSDIKGYMDLFGHEPPIDKGVSDWTIFCQFYFSPYITAIWDDTVKELKIKFLGAKEIKNKELFDQDPKWKNMIQILGDSAIGSSDAMILNLFQESKLSLLITADKSLKNTALNRSLDRKFILSPTSD